MLTDLEIARQAQMNPVTEIAAKLEIPEEALSLYGKYKSKISLDFCQSLDSRPNGKLILVTAISPTPAGEGKTTTVVGLGDALARAGKKAAICLREPSMGPCFGIKGGAAGGGYSQVVPMEDINLHFTGDMHAIASAHNLLAAMLDNHIQHGNPLDIDPRTIPFGRTLDMNDRSLRDIIVGLGGTSDGIPRESFFSITSASEVMATFCLSQSLRDLHDRLGRIILGQTRQKTLVRAADIRANGAMTVLLKDALQPNLVQTLEHTPAFIHGGPFANIAHGCSSVLATRLSLKLADYTVTEAGFGADLGAEKFMDIKCRKAGICPDAIVLVATIRALKYHGGAAIEELRQPNVYALSLGGVNLERHIRNLRRFGRPIIVALNTFETDSPEEIHTLKIIGEKMDVKVIEASHFANGGAGAADLADEVIRTIDAATPGMEFLYPDEIPLWEKVNIIARVFYGARAAVADKKVVNKFQQLEDQGFKKFPICMAKTQFSFSDDPKMKGAPENFDLKIRDVKASAGAEFVIAFAGDIMTMPGLPKAPAAENIDIDENGNIVGLF